MEMAIGSEVQGLELGHDSPIYPASRSALAMELGQLDQREQAGGVGGKGLIRVTQISSSGHWSIR